jgi:hypothetical protein
VIAHLFDWLAQTRLSNSLRFGVYYFPVLTIIHIVSIGLFGGTVIIANLRILGAALQDIPVSRVFNQLRPWKWGGFFILLVTGIFMALSDPLEYRDNIMFWISMLILLIVGVDAFNFRRGVFSSVQDWDEAPRAPERARAWAVRSLVLWTCLVFAGRATAFF